MVGKVESLGLAKKRHGLTSDEILQSISLGSGGSASRRLEELEESGFILSRIPFGKKANETLYRLCDEYSLFYLDLDQQDGKEIARGWLLVVAAEFASSKSLGRLCLRRRVWRFGGGQDSGRI